MDENAPLCEMKGIVKDFALPEGKVLHVLEEINLQIYSDEILAIIGPSGCGKSTLIRILIGLMSPTKGEIFYQGKQVQGMLPDFSLVFQSFALYPWMTVTQNIEMVLKTMLLSGEEIKKRAHEVIAKIGLVGFEESYPREISSGMKQRVGLARALVRNPELLVLDEPFSSLDAFTAEVLREELLHIWSNKGYNLKTIVLISHDVREVAFLADRIVMMEANPGRIRYIKDNKLPRPRNAHSQEFLNLVDELHDAYSQKEKVPPEVPAPALPFATPEEILGFLVHIRRFGGSKDLYQIDGGSVDHFHRILNRAWAAQLLNFVQIEDRMVTLTDIGKHYLASINGKRREIWREQLLKIPIFGKAVNWLKSAPKHALKIKQLVDLIAKEHPSQDPHQQCKILVIWGSFGNLFVHRKGSQTVHLKD